MTNETLRIIFVHSGSMFLTTPTLEELKEFEVPDLVDMLARHTVEYIDLFKKEGTTSTTLAQRDMINNIQRAIDAKKSQKN